VCVCVCVASPCLLCNSGAPTVRARTFDFRHIRQTFFDRLPNMHTTATTVSTTASSFRQMTSPTTRHAWICFWQCTCQTVAEWHSNRAVVQHPPCGTAVPAIHEGSAAGEPHRPATGEPCQQVMHYSKSHSWSNERQTLSLEPRRTKQREPRRTKQQARETDSYKFIFTSTFAPPGMGCTVTGGGGGSWTDGGAAGGACVGIGAGRFQLIERLLPCCAIGRGSSLRFFLCWRPEFGVGPSILAEFSWGLACRVALPLGLAAAFCCPVRAELCPLQTELSVKVALSYLAPEHNG